MSWDGSDSDVWFWGHAGTESTGRTLHPSSRSWSYNGAGALLDDDAIHGSMQIERPAVEWCAEAVAATPLETWHVPLAADRHAVALLNRSPEAATMRVELANLPGLQSPGRVWEVKDVWRNTTSMCAKSVIAKEVPAYGAVVLVLS